MTIADTPLQAPERAARVKLVKMGATKDYFKAQFQWPMFLLEYEDASEFYLSAFQKNRSPVPLLLLRALICFGCVAIVVSSAVLSVEMMSVGHWPIFLTHWGLILNMITAAFAVVVSARAYLRGPIDAIFGLPWYVKMYWAMTNIATAIAFFITIFYWTLLSNNEEDYAVSLTLDIFIHAVNTILMLTTLLSSKQPYQLLHVYQPVVVGLIYAIFSVIYYFAGGTHPFTGGTYIYPVLDWSEPGMAIVTVVLSMVLLIVLHAVCALLAVLRDVLSRRLLRDTKYSMSSENF